MSRLYFVFFLVLFALPFVADGQEMRAGEGQGIERNDFQEKEDFDPLQTLDLNLAPLLGDQEHEAPGLPALQPGFVVPPLSHERFPELPIQETVSRDAILRLDAHLSPQLPPLARGLVWRIFSAEIGLDNKLPLIDTKQGGQAQFQLPAGEYFVHVAFGRAQLSKRFELEAGRTYYENIDLEAGGIILDVETQEGTINKNRVRFSLYKQSDDVSGQVLVVEDVKPEIVVRLKAGNYHVISTYGDANAIASADIRVEAGKLTQAMIKHYGAQITLKLLRDGGSEALADTSWVILNASGDTIGEFANAYVDIVLAEGDYIAYARNKEQSYVREFSVSPGLDVEIDLIIGRDNVEGNIN